MYLYHSIIHKVERVKLDFLKIVTLYQHNGVELSRHTTRLVTLSVVVVEIRYRQYDSTKDELTE